VTALQRVAGTVGRRFGAEIVVHGATVSPRVALTIDDGPDPATTPDLLTVLAGHDTRATFFLIGERAMRHAGLVADIAAAGHELGNHLMRDEPSALLRRDEFYRQLHTVHRLLSASGTVEAFRPGSGWVTPSMLRAAGSLGYRCALGSPGLVAKGYPDPAGLAERLARRSRPGSVVVLHEGTRSRAPVVEVVDVLLGALARKGLRASPLRQV
jgi:peptidoglycan/xylan/chitin deacetylase (PgdA/CDA1 family)